MAEVFEDDGGRAGQVRASAALMTAVGGSSRQRSRVWLIAGEVDPERVRALVSEGDTVMAPSGAVADVDGVSVVTLDGVYGREGEELTLGGDTYLDQHSYSAMAFQPLTAPTIVHIGDAADHDVFIEDADIAREDGIFPDRLLHPSVVLADPGAAVADELTPERLAARLVVDGEGVRTGLRDTLLVPLGDATAVRIADAVRDHRGSLDGSSGPEVREAAREAARSRPWLHRYRQAIEALRTVRTRGSDPTRVRVSGFGHRIVPSSVGMDDRPGAPLLLVTDEEHLAFDVVTGRWFSVGADAARLMEVLGTGDGPATAAERGAEALGVSVDEARTALVEIGESFARRGLALPGVSTDVAETA